MIRQEVPNSGKILKYFLHEHVRSVVLILHDLVGSLQDHFRSFLVLYKSYKISELYFAQKHA